MAPKMLKRPASRAALEETPTPAAKRAAAARSTSKAAVAAAAAPSALQGLRAFVVNLERRPDRWTRISEMLKKETPWLDFEQFKASDGSQSPIPEEDVSLTWSTSRNAHYADYYKWAFDAPGTPLDGTQWKWACDASADDGEWRFTEDGGEEWSYIHHAGETKVRTGSVEKIATQERFKVRLQFAGEYLEPGRVQRMSGGERGCAHSHLRLWRVAAERPENTLVLEDDVQLVFERSDAELGTSSGEVFTERLRRALEHAPADFDVLYLGWSGWRDGHYLRWQQPQEERSERDRYIRKAEYVWTTVAYVISQAGAKKLLAAAAPVNQPVDNFMAWEASQGRLNSYVVLDEGDDDGMWTGGIVDQFDFQGDSDIQKSDGGHQGDDEKQFAVQA
eukprot:CAMPEP_0179077408 /NCGR_PEP_ID=MMETSP0796-20121207/34599_1 /TAXON_ID=73915 /ORGANISM="Pyrodinium bahamense, Strain pbaha01" /LENGTH=390 /DNA_ID=CAMNT_0020774687 /DNA_START=124 /DNA_END=1296 /DNA_ORIENTATION=+